MTRTAAWHARLGLLPVAACWVASAASAAAPTTAAIQDSQPEAIVVSAGRLCRLTDAQLRAALRAYRSGRSADAPDARLYFEARSDAGRPMADGASLRLVRGGRTVPVPRDPAGRFVLPDVPGSGWTLESRCDAGGVSVVPLVMSPGTTPDDRRLGDLRLQCAVGWAITTERLAGTSGTFVAAAESCKSSSTGFYAPSLRPILAATVTVGAISYPVPLSSERRRYRLPLGDRRLPNTARVRFRYDEVRPSPDRP